MTRVALAVLAALALAAGSVVKTPATGSAGSFELLILHNNDMHARFEQTSQLSGTCTTEDREAGRCYGGFARVAHVVKEARKAAANGSGPPVLYLNAGDTYTGTAWFTIYKWQIAAEFINALKPDAVSLGNHEFDNGVSGLTPFIENLTSPVLAANLNLKKVPELRAEKNLMNSVIFEIGNVKIGIIGYLTPETKVLAIRNDVEYIDEVVALKEEVVKLKNLNVNILIALGHSGFKRDLEIAKQVEDIDLVIGGHTNTFLWNGSAPDTEVIDGPYPTLVKQASGRVVPVVQAYAYTKYLGKLNLIFNNKGEIISFSGKPILLDKSIPQDPNVLAIVEKYKENVTKITDTIIGTTSVLLEQRACRFGECNLANMITDAIIYKYASHYSGEGWTDAPIAVIQRGGIRAPIAPFNLPAPVTKGDLIAVLPFEGNIVKISINGSDLLIALERSISEYTPLGNSGHFLHYSGVKITYDLRRKAGHQIIHVAIRCGKCAVPKFEPLLKTKEYNILMTSFLSNGGNGYSIFSTLPAVTMNYSDLDATTAYVETHSPLYAAVEDRITLLNTEYTSSAPIFLPNLLVLITAVFLCNKIGLAW